VAYNKSSSRSPWPSTITSLAVFIPILGALLIGIATAKQTLFYHLPGITVTAQVSQATVITMGLIMTLLISILALPTFYFLREKGGKISKGDRVLLILGAVLVSIIIIVTGPYSNVWGRVLIVIIGAVVLGITGAGYADIIHSIRTSSKNLDIGVALLKFIGITIITCFLLMVFITRSVAQQIKVADYYTVFKYEDKSYVIISKEANNYLVSELCAKANTARYGSFRYVPLEKVAETSLQEFALKPGYCNDPKRKLPRYIF
jgi:hypothetical protein